MSVPAIRIDAVNDAPLRPEGDYVLYWMIATRRTRWSFALDRALEHCRELGKPLLVLEAIRVGYRWASARLHGFAIDGMRDNQVAFEQAGITYYPYVEPEAGAGSGLLEALAERACVVVTDEFPCFFLPRMVAAAGPRLSVRLEQVDSNGVVPLRATERAFPRAHSFRRWLHKNVLPYLLTTPATEPLQDAEVARGAVIPEGVAERWPAADPQMLTGDRLGELPIDQAVQPVPYRGGQIAGREQVSLFMGSRLGRYAEQRNHPDEDAQSGLSPYLHWGHVSAHEVIRAVLLRDGWTPPSTPPKATGSREGWWGVSEEVEAFLDEILTWREVGYGFCFHRNDYDRYESLPDWALKTLDEHAGDHRPHLYDLEELAQARTHDRLWNATQRQLLIEGRIHNYLRMLWGKKIFEWSPSPQVALERLIELNNRYAVDGRDPNSYSGIFWVLGRFDRAWGPERPVYGKIRYMTSESAARKLRLGGYMDRYERLGR